jgi:isopentenyl diphosphate isomerase/L-lactate dehydrogenase-like FMN-dependent dehydrogenase
MINSASYPEHVDVVELRGFEKLAVQKLTPDTYAYFAGGSADESTLRDNEAAFSRRVLRGGGPVDIADVDLSTSMLGMRVAMPIAFAPVALQGLAHKDGEVVPARVAARSNIVACVSTLSSQSLESVSAVGGTRWFQLYVLRDRRISEKLVERAIVSGYQAIVLTVDLRPAPAGALAQSSCLKDCGHATPFSAADRNC